MKKAMVRFRGAWENGAIPFLECLEVSQEGTMKGPLVKGDLRQEPEIA